MDGWDQESISDGPTAGSRRSVSRTWIDPSPAQEVGGPGGLASALTTSAGTNCPAGQQTIGQFIYQGVGSACRWRCVWDGSARSMVICKSWRTRRDVIECEIVKSCFRGSLARASQPFPCRDPLCDPGVDSANDRMCLKDGGTQTRPGCVTERTE